MASERAKPKMAYEKSCCFKDGFRAYPIIKEPNTEPIPAPEPATPTVAAPAPMNFAAESISRDTGDVDTVRWIGCELISVDRLLIKNGDAMGRIPFDDDEIVRSEAPASRKLFMISEVLWMDCTCKYRV